MSSLCCADNNDVDVSIDINNNSSNQKLTANNNINNNKPSHLKVCLKNVATNEECEDVLHKQALASSCNQSRCLAALMNPIARTVKSQQDTLKEAMSFISQFYKSIKRAPEKRLAEVEAELAATGTYYLRETELIYGAKLAWRNSARCIGRIQWSKLQVFDARFTANCDEMFEAICNHIKYATNKGQLRSAITILPQRVKSCAAGDWRVWNNQLIGYAGYKDADSGKIIGDPINAEMTQICQRLGWKGRGTRFDVLPIVLSSPGGQPKMYELPDDLVLRVKISHPKYAWFADLGLEWYALPAVSSMMLDVGGLQFTAAPFNGWYMVTEIGTRDLADSHRYNVLESVAIGLGLNTKTNASLWKDSALVELNIAVLSSFRNAGVTIVDHHTAVESFMTHFANETRLRGGCPADWVWLVPPTSGSTMQIFHQELTNYHLLPNYEYMPPAWQNFDWTVWQQRQLYQQQQQQQQQQMMRSIEATSGQQKSSTVSCVAASLKSKLAAACIDLRPIQSQASNASMSAESPNNPLASISLQSQSSQLTSPLYFDPICSTGNQTNSSTPSSSITGGELTPRKLRFKEIARAVKFTSKLFGKALSRRIKATILYASETGKSERFANKLAQTFSRAFNVHLMSMSDYDMTCLEHEALLLIVTSTFGNGDPPENGEAMAKHLAAVKLTGDTSPDIDSINSVSSNSFFQLMSQPTPICDDASDTSELDKNKLNTNDDHSVSVIRPLSNVRFGVFALGSTAYPHFCSFGRYVDQTLAELGAERILKCFCGDELCGQEKAFNEWSSLIFKTACDVFCITDSLNTIDDRPKVRWSCKDVRFLPVVGRPKNRNHDHTKHTNNNGHDGYDDDEDDNYDDDYHDNDNENGNDDYCGVVSMTNKKIAAFKMKSRWNLHEYVEGDELQTICVDLVSNDKSLCFEPGDHVALYARNNLSSVNAIIDRMKVSMSKQQTTLPADSKQHTYASSSSSSSSSGFDFDKVYQILVKRDNMDLTPTSATVNSATVNNNQSIGKVVANLRKGLSTTTITSATTTATTATTATTTSTLTNNHNSDEEKWVPHDWLPIASVREALTRYVDITSPPSQDFLSILSRQCTDQNERKSLQQLARNFTLYEDWKSKTAPNLVSVLQEFKAIQFYAECITQLPVMKPRFYSISGSGVSLTVGVVRYNNCLGHQRLGLCSNYLLNIALNSANIFGYIRSAPAFHMPQDKKLPLIMIGAGTGIAPFRSFWQQRKLDIDRQRKFFGGLLDDQQIIDSYGKLELYFGCRNSNFYLHKQEIMLMRDTQILSGVHIAFSRPLDCDVVTEKKRVYVQDKILENKSQVCKLILEEEAHVYVCGDVAMADDVYKVLVALLTQQTMLDLRSMNRYHEDIFGAKNS